ncbi:MAG: GmrSD restriction endonuclease domain-containing protein [Solirubrobacterales bacterium]
MTQNDRASLLALIQQKPQPTEYSIRIKQNFEFFETQIHGLKGDLTALCQGLAKLIVVDISLSREQDNPQLIFESMNSTGRELSQADLIRNFVLMGLEAQHQTRLYEDHWRPMEVAFGQDAYGTHFDGFMRHYLTLKTGDIPNVNAVYEAFKAYARQPDVATEGVDALVADVHAVALHYCALALGQEPDKELGNAFRDLRELKVDVAYPFLLELYEDYAGSRLGTDEFVRAIRLVEAYVFRRAVCAIPTNSLNKTFATFGRDLKKDRYLESIQAHLLQLPSYRRFPSDEEFKQELGTRDLYNFRSRSYWLRRLENYGRKERVPVDEFTIEHIMPQNENLSAEWRAALGPEWERVHQSLLHTLGNLTLTGYNSEYSDRPFAEKRDMPGGFNDSPLKLNRGLASLLTWDEGAIKTRAERLAILAAEVWAPPKLAPDVLDSYRPTAVQQMRYGIDDHEWLAEGAPMNPLFQTLRKEICELDAVVSEEFLKLYVAYKAETNFVDVVPQQKRLLLSLNIDPHELVDPKGIARDVTNLGRWGNGDVEVALSSLEGLPYAMGLIRQAFEKQMGGVEAVA